MKKKTKERIKDYIKILALGSFITTLWVIASLIASLF